MTPDVHGPRKRRWPARAALVALVAGLVTGGIACRQVAGPTGRAIPNPSPLERQDVTLVEGHEAVVLASGGMLVFEQVEQDSRCPSDVVCAWIGKAKANFVLLEPGGTSVPFSLEIYGGVTAADTLKNGPLGFLTTDVGRLRVTLMQLDPYPLSNRDPLALTSTALVRVQW